MAVSKKRPHRHEDSDRQYVGLDGRQQRQYSDYLTDIKTEIDNYLGALPPGRARFKKPGLIT